MENHNATVHLTSFLCTRCSFSTVLVLVCCFLLSTTEFRFCFLVACLSIKRESWYNLILNCLSSILLTHAFLCAVELLFMYHFFCEGFVGVPRSISLCLCVLSGVSDEEDQKPVRLPLKVAVELQPRSNHSWARVQSLAHNPRLRSATPVNSCLLV